MRIILTFLWCAALGTVLAQPVRTGRDYALFFYVTDFQPGWTSLPETAKEAAELKTELETNFGFTCELVPNPTKQQIRAAIRNYNARLTANDQVFFFFSMHGHYVASSDRGYLIGKDGATRDEYGDTWYSYDDLRTDLAPCKAKHVLLALDACHSGSFGIRNKGRPTAPEYERGEDCQSKVAKTMQYTGRQYCTSGNKNDKTPAKSLFAARLLEALRNGGVLHFDDIEYYIGKVENPKPESGSFGAHDPGGDFVFVRKNACGNAPDRDGDGVPDSADTCPDIWGSQANGCPTDTPKGGDLADDLAAWRKAKAANNKAAYLEYLREYPNGELKDAANAALRRIEAEALQRRDDTTWELATEKNTLTGYKQYLTDWPTGRHAAEAKEAIKALERPDDGLVFIKGGTFTMGCTNEQKDCSGDETPIHSVTLSDFYLGQHEVTQKLWQDIMGTNPSGFKNCDQCPVEEVSWDEVQDFLKKLNAKYPERNYRLPTEAEWEYAAREGGRAVLFGNGKNVLDSKDANFNASNAYKKAYSIGGTYRQKTTPVGSFAPNALGLYDMAGNVWEWCSDWYGAYAAGSQTNPTGPSSGSYRVLRGGSWYLDAQNCRVSYRPSYAPKNRNLNIGFRLASSPQ
jgi:formylglycine-generating enzyme